jgi:F0F1-type ATP synthase alpha subunit
MAITLHAVNKGLFDDVEVKKALATEKQMHGFVKQKYADLVTKIETTKDLDADALSRSSPRRLRNSRPHWPDRSRRLPCLAARKSATRSRA